MRRLTVHSLTAARWPDFVRLFGARGVGGGCWCMGWRLPRQQYLRQKGDANKRAMRALVLSGCVPGLLAYAGAEPVGWVAPRDEYPALERSRSRRAVDGQPVWSITCVYVARSHRRRHLSRALIEAAVRHVRARGGRIVEAYPVPPKPGVGSTNYAYTGFVSPFEEAGFIEHARRFPTRPVMRYQIR
jgi:GNAT superfamily N-acetyltransferase